LLTIVGQGLQLDGTSVTDVRLAGIAVERIVSQTDTQVVAVAGESLETGDLDVDVIANTGHSSSKPLAWAYLEPSVIRAVSPAAGQFGTRVTLTGERMTGGGASIVSVYLGAIRANLVSTSATSIEVIVADGAATSSSDITVTSDTGARSVLPGGFVQLERGHVGSTTLNDGQVGSTFEIRGTNLLGGGRALSSVTVVGVEVASIVSQSDTIVQVILDHGMPGQGDVVLTSETGAVVVGLNGFSLLEPGIVSLVAPAEGQLGTAVAITGERLRGGGNAIVSVHLAGVLASLRTESDQAVAVVVAESPANVGHVVLRADTGATVTAPNAWTYLNPGAIQDISPSSGVRGTRIVIDGERLGGGGSIDSVTLAGVLATIVTATNSQISLVAMPTTNPGIGDVIITADTGATVIRSAGFEYLQPGVLDLGLFGPDIGQTGTKVTVCGSNLLGGGARFEQALLDNCELNIVTQGGDCIELEV